MPWLLSDKVLRYFALLLYSVVYLRTLKNIYTREFRLFTGVLYGGKDMFIALYEVTGWSLRC